MGRVAGVRGMRKKYNFQCENLTERDNLGDQVADWKLILKCMHKDIVD